jgi:hypothetical protein
MNEKIISRVRIALELLGWAFLLGTLVYGTIQEKKVWDCTSDWVWMFMIPVLLIASVLITCANILCYLADCAVRWLGISSTFVGLLLSAGLFALSISHAHLPACTKLSTPPLQLLQILSSLGTLSFFVALCWRWYHPG